MEKFAVTINYHGNYGYIEYDPETKSADVHLGVEGPKADVEKYLEEAHTFKVAVATACIDDYINVITVLCGSHLREIRRSHAVLAFKVGAAHVDHHGDGIFAAAFYSSILIARAACHRSIGF